MQNKEDLFTIKLENIINKTATEKERSDFFHDNFYKELLFKEANYQIFIKVIKEMTPEELLDYIDEQFGQLLFQDINRAQKLAVIINSKKIKDYEVLLREPYVFLIHSNLHIINLSSVSISFIKKLLIKKFNINILASLDLEEQKELLKDLEIQELFKDHIINNGYESLFKLNINIIMENNLLDRIDVINEFLKLDIREISRLISDGLIIPNHLINSELLVNKYLQIESINFYRELVERLFLNNYNLYLNITKKKNEEYDNLMSSRICINHRHFTEILVDRFFGDLAYNFLKNLKQMLSFIRQSYMNELIPRERLNIYHQIIEIESLSLEQRKKLYHSLNDGKNYQELFYEDYRNCKNASYEDINKRLLKPTDLELSKTYSKKAGVPVYDLDGDDFKALVHVTDCNRDNKDVAEWENGKEPTLSISLISDSMFTTILDPCDTVILGFDNIRSDQVVHVYNSDSFTSLDMGTNKINKIYTAERLIQDTHCYNEILYQEYPIYNNKKVEDNSIVPTPSYVLSFDYINLSDIKTAKKLNIPIIVFHSDLYEGKYTDPLAKQDKYLLSFEIDKLPKY